MGDNFKMGLKKYAVRAWAEFSYLEIGTRD
jgi:hypothetical protein